MFCLHICYNAPFPLSQLHYCCRAFSYLQWRFLFVYNDHLGSSWNVHPDKTFVMRCTLFRILAGSPSHSPPAQALRNTLLLPEVRDSGGLQPPSAWGPGTLSTVETLLLAVPRKQGSKYYYAHFVSRDLMQVIKTHAATSWAVNCWYLMTFPKYFK